MLTPMERKVATPLRTENRVLVVGKFTRYMYATERNQTDVLALIAANHPAVSHIVPEHDEHMRSLDKVLADLKDFDVELIRADALKTTTFDQSHFRLALGVGGDGTILDLSHHVSTLALLGVNSASRSHGHFDLATAATFRQIFDEILAGKRTPLSLMRINAYLDGKRIGPYVLNEVAVKNPGGATNYMVTVNGKVEEQQSDGFLLAPASGSTAWMHWYGSKVMPVLDRDIQFLMQGGAPERRMKFGRGFIRGRDLRVVSKDSHTVIATDGMRNSHPFPLGSELIVKPSPNDLLLYADAECNSRYVSSRRRRSR